MTGFGRAEVAGRRRKVSVEARSVNNKGLDVRVRAPQELGPFEEEIRRLVRERFSRGSVQVSLTVEGGSRGKVSLDRAAAAALARELRRLGRELKLPGEVTLDNLTRFPSVLLAPAPGADEGELWRDARRAVIRALDGLAASRRREGAVTRRALLGHLRALAAQAAAIRRLAPAALRSAAAGIGRRVREMLAGADLDRRRVEEEAALLVTRRDFSEELDRLEGHLAALREVMDRRGPVGRNLEFLTQETLRELTTIASKAPGERITAHTVRARVELEKIREQVYNVE